jgi:hypothetical protein
MRMKLLQIVEPFHQRWSKRDSSRDSTRIPDKQYVLNVVYVQL